MAILEQELAGGQNVETRKACGISLVRDGNNKMLPIVRVDQVTAAAAVNTMQLSFTNWCVALTCLLPDEVAQLESSDELMRIMRHGVETQKPVNLVDFQARQRDVTEQRAYPDAALNEYASLGVLAHPEIDNMRRKVIVGASTDGATIARAKLFQVRRELRDHLHPARSHLRTRARARARAEPPRQRQEE